jgi:hypothetical protein
MNSALTTLFAAILDHGVERHYEKAATDRKPQEIAKDAQPPKLRQEIDDADQHHLRRHRGPAGEPEIE